LDNSSSRHGVDFSKSKLQTLFEKYADPIPEGASEKAPPRVIGIDGILTLCEDLEVEPEDAVMLVFSWQLKATEQGVYPEEIFIQGLTELRIDSLEKLKNMIPTWREMLNDEATFKDIYAYSFRFCTGPTGKVLDLELSAEMISMLLSNRFKNIDMFCEFLLKQTSYKVMNADQWINFYEFCSAFPDGVYESYDSNDPWPVMFDEYIEWLKSEEQRRRGASEEATAQEKSRKHEEEEEGTSDDDETDSATESESAGDEESI